MYRNRRQRPFKKNIKQSTVKKQQPKRKPAPSPELTHMGLSPSLMALIGIAMQDGLSGQSVFSMLKDIYPYVSPEDRHAIEHALQYRNVADTLTNTPSTDHDYIKPYHSKRVLGSKEKFLCLLQTLSRYSGQKARRTYAQLERYVDLQGRLHRLQKDGLSIGNLPDIMGMFTSPDQPDHHRAAEDIGRATSFMQAMQGMQDGQMDMASMANMLGNMGGGNSSGGGMDTAMLMQMMQMMQQK